MIESGKGLTLLFFALMVSSGCVADSIDEDGALGQTLDKFGDFSEENGTTSYEFSLESLTDNGLMGPMEGVIDDYKNNLSESSGVQIKASNIEIIEMSSDKARIKVDYVGETDSDRTLDREVTFTFVKENGRWQLQGPLSENMDTDMPTRSQYQ
jgi:hypothetical protein